MYIKYYNNWNGTEEIKIERLDLTIRPHSSDDGKHFTLINCNQARDIDEALVDLISEFMEVLHTEEILTKYSQVQNFLTGHVDKGRYHNQSSHIHLCGLDSLSATQLKAFLRMLEGSLRRGDNLFDATSVTIDKLGGV